MKTESSWKVGDRVETTCTRRGVIVGTVVKTTDTASPLKVKCDGGGFVSLNEEPDAWRRVSKK